MSGMVPIVPGSPLRRNAGLLAEGLLFAGAGLVFANAIGVPQRGFLAIFLAAAGLTGRFNKLLDENRSDILVRRLSSRRVNAKTALSVLMLFVGVAVADAIAALWWGEAALRGSFGFALDAAGLGQESLFTRRFAALGPTVVHNGLVLATFFALAFVYRAYGALLALCWNACVWAMVLALLAGRAAHASAVPGVVFVPAALLAVVPHLLIEAASYVTGALAGIFLSKALMAYAPTDPVFRSVARAVATLLALAAAGVVLGAVVETLLPPAILSRL